MYVISVFRAYFVHPNLAKKYVIPGLTVGKHSGMWKETALVSGSFGMKYSLAPAKRNSWNRLCVGVRGLLGGPCPRFSWCKSRMEGTDLYCKLLIEVVPVSYLVTNQYQTMIDDVARLNFLRWHRSIYSGGRSTLIIYIHKRSNTILQKNLDTSKSHAFSKQNKYK